MDTALALQSRLIGTIFVAKGLITDDQLERALELQKDTGERLGEIVVAEFGVSRLELASVLAEQWAELETPVASDQEAAVVPLALVEEPPIEPAIRRPIGEIFVELGFISRDQLEAALDTQRETGARIGEVLVEQGSLTRLDLASALAEQWSALQKLRPPAPVIDPQPWQNGAPTTAPLSAGEPAIAALEERLRLVERAAVATPWQDDLATAAAELRNAITSIEGRLDDNAPDFGGAELGAEVDILGRRLESLEQAAATDQLEALRDAIQEVRDRPVTVEGLTELRDAVAAMEGRPDLTEELRSLGSDVTALGSRVDELVRVGDLHERLDAVASQAESAQQGLDGLARRVDDLASVEQRLDELDRQLPSAEVVDEMRGTLANLASAKDIDRDAVSSNQVAALVARLDEISARVDATASAKHSHDDVRLDELASRVNEVADALADDRTTDFAERLDSLETASREDSGEIERVEAALLELRSRTRERFESLVSQTPDLGPTVERLQVRIEELAAALPDPFDPTVVDDLRGRLEELSASAAPRSDLEALESVQTRVEQLAGSVARAEAVEALEARIDALSIAAEREPDLSVVEEIRAEVESLSSMALRRSDVEALEARIEELAARPVPLPDLSAIDDLRAEFSALGSAAVRPAALDELRAQIDKVAVQAQSKPDLSVVHELREQIEQLASSVAQEELVGQLEHRIGEVERRLSESDSAAELRDEIRRVSESASSERQSLSEALLARVEEIAATTPRAEEMESLRAQLDEVAARPAVGDSLRDRVGRLSERMDRLGEVEATVSELRTALDNHENVRVNDALAIGARLVSLETAIETLEGAENRIREAVAGQIDGVAADAETARGQLRTELGVELRAELGARLDDRAGMLDARIDEHWGETSALRSEIEGLRAAVAARADADARLEQLLDERLEGLSAHVASEVGRVRLDVDTTVTMALDTVRGEATALGARLDHVVGLRSADVEAARAAGAHLEGRLDALAALRADDAEAAQIAAGELAERLSALALSLHAEAAGARASAETVAAQVADLHGLRSEDRAATELAGAELAARLDDHAVRSAAAAFEVEQALRDELGGVAARLEERDAQGIEAREELRAELERVGLSVGWRLEQIEVSLAADESAALKVSVAELQHRLDAHAAIGDEQVRTTERALRKGLAALGERLVDTEEAYLEAGNTLRRSIERLGAAVVEADARMADQIPVSTAEGCVAFAPTPDGYRLVELPGPAPELGSTLELEESEGLLVVTRYGRSPLPLDSRPCAYLDRA